MASNGGTRVSGLGALRPDHVHFVLSTREAAVAREAVVTMILTDSLGA